MKIFIAGATGVLGRRVTRRLLDLGHTVIGLSRSTANAEWLAAQGAVARSGDLFDGEQMVQLTSDCDALLHLATAIPTGSRTRLADWRMNDRIRREGTQNLVAAALRNHCRVYVQESVTYLYGDRGGDWVDESTPLPDRQPRILESALMMERTVREGAQHDGLPAHILRFGSLYAHDSAQTAGMLRLAQAGRLPVLGDGRGYWNSIHVDDAALAVCLAVANRPGAEASTLNVCDDTPISYGDLVAYLTRELGAGRPRHLPKFMARVALGGHVVDAVFASVRCRNERIKQALGWRPNFPNAQDGYSAVIDQWRRSDAERAQEHEYDNDTGGNL